jgi:hypothetical protein
MGKENTGGVLTPMDELKDTAKFLFADKVRRGNMLPHEIIGAAKKSLWEAKAFLDACDKYESGEIPATMPVEPKARKIEVPQWDLGDNDRWTPRIDEKTGRQVIFEEFMDPHAFARNLPIDHPANVRHGVATLAVDPKTGKTEAVEALNN